VVEALTEFGERVGRAFQLGDDLLDITADAAVAGKAPGGDLRAGVRTLPILYLLRDGGPDADRLTAVLDAVPAGPVRTALGQVADQVLDRQV
jgi:heptaprenyl diphosphate synthase